jgi:ABC-type multidrug transport system ATPase subunit
MRLEAKEIGKEYGGRWIFRNVSKQFDRGGIYPVIGHNGSGKSTFIQILSGYVTANEGTLHWIQREGELLVEDWHQHLSISAPYMDLFEEFTVEESVTLHQEFKPLLVDSVAALLEEIELTDHRNKPLSQLSSGMRQRLKLALAIYSESELLLLDEPCSNLDQRWSEWYAEAVQKMHTQRVTIICSNNQASEIGFATEVPLDISAPSHRG